jgi:hypothetical protein
VVPVELPNDASILVGKVPRLHHAFTAYKRAGQGADLEPKVKHAPATRLAIEDHEHLVYEAVSF